MPGGESGKRRVRFSGRHEFCNSLLAGCVVCGCVEDFHLLVSAPCRAHQKEKATLISQRGLYLCRQRPTLPHTFACSTIGPAGLNFRVRDGNGWNPRGKITDNLEPSGISRQPSAVSHQEKLAVLTPNPPLRGKLLKELENEASQLNRLGVA